MGKDLAERFPAARDVFGAVDDALGFALSRIMWEGPESELTRTHNAQPAILAHSLAVHAVLRDRLEPVGAAGHSLGEYSAYTALGAMTLEDGVRLVRRRAELMLVAGEQRPGAMAAVLGLDADDVTTICREVSNGSGVVVAANMNAPGQVVISGDTATVARAAVALTTAGARRVIGLKVSGAFHSPLMEPVLVEFLPELERVALRDPPVPVVANATAEPVRDATTARQRLGEQLMAPVRWVESMQAAASMSHGAAFVEIGPGNVLTGLLKRIVDGAKTVNVATAADIDRMG